MPNLPTNFTPIRTTYPPVGWLEIASIAIPVESGLFWWRHTDWETKVIGRKEQDGGWFMLENNTLLPGACHAELQYHRREAEKERPYATR